MMRVGAVGNRVLCGFPRPCGRVLGVQRAGSVHARRWHFTSLAAESDRRRGSQIDSSPGATSAHVVSNSRNRDSAAASRWPPPCGRSTRPRPPTSRSVRSTPSRAGIGASGFPPSWRCGVGHGGGSSPFSRSRPRFAASSTRPTRWRASTRSCARSSKPAGTFHTTTRRPS